MPVDFDVAALHAALDAQRQSRGLTWQQVTREINALFRDVPARPISRSTVTGLRDKTVVEGDGVLQMLRWLGRTPESFVPDGAGIAEHAPLPHVDTRHIVRFDAAAMYAALNVRRIQRRMTWTQIANEIGGVNAASLTRLVRGGRVAFPPVMRITGWLGEPAARFTRICDR